VQCTPFPVKPGGLRSCSAWAAHKAGLGRQRQGTGSACDSRSSGSGRARAAHVTAGPQAAAARVSRAHNGCEDGKRVSSAHEGGPMCRQARLDLCIGAPLVAAAHGAGHVAACPLSAPLPLCSAPGRGKWGTGAPTSCLPAKACSAPLCRWVRPRPCAPLCIACITCIACTTPALLRGGLGLKASRYMPQPMPACRARETCSAPCDFWFSTPLPARPTSGLPAGTSSQCPGHSCNRACGK